ncbi:DUF2782 domain-containing protein [Marinobacteraceae bacterium S3BR75-40.1]
MKSLRITAVFLAVAATLATTTAVRAEEPVRASEYQRQQQANEPQIVIRHEKKKTIYEYRVNGMLKEIKVVPENGAPYYLVPSEGGDMIREDKSELLIPSWVIFSW